MLRRDSRYIGKGHSRPRAARLEEMRKIPEKIYGCRKGGHGFGGCNNKEMEADDPLSQEEAHVPEVKSVDLEVNAC